MQNSNVVAEIRVPRLSAGNTYRLVEDHPLKDKTLKFKFKVLGVYLNPDTGRKILKLEAPSGKTQLRSSGRRLYRHIDLDE